MQSPTPDTSIRRGTIDLIDRLKTSFRRLQLELARKPGAEGTKRSPDWLELAGALVDTFDPVGYVDDPPELLDIPGRLMINEATFMCIRGPCVHWLGLRFPAQVQSIPKHFHTNLSFHCMIYGELEPIRGTDICLSCTQWWPQGIFGFVPESLRVFFREPLRELWERLLVLRGYRFYWRQSIPRWIQDSAQNRRYPFLPMEELKARRNAPTRAEVKQAPQKKPQKMPDAPQPRFKAPEIIIDKTDEVVPKPSNMIPSRR